MTKSDGLSANSTDAAPIEGGAPPDISRFDEDLIKKYPRSNRRVQLDVQPYSLLTQAPNDQKAHTVHISPHGLEFQSAKDYPQGSLLKIHVVLPDYWNRKQQFVEYGRVDTPAAFKLLAKVVRSEDLGKRGKKKLVIVQTVNMDEIDEQVLKSYLQEG